MIEPDMNGLTSFILDMPLELQILLLSSIVCGLVFLVSEKVSKNTKNKNNNLNPFSLTVDLTAKQIKQIKDYKHNDKH